MSPTFGIFSTFALFGLIYSLPAQTFLINEFDPDTADSEDASEFVEIVSVDASGNLIGNQSLEDLVLVFFNGNSSSNASYNRIPLTGTTNENGFFLIADSALLGADLALPGALQNGTDAIALYIGSSEDFPNGTLPGAVNPVTLSPILDAVVYGKNEFNGSPPQDDFELREALAPDGITLSLFNESGDTNASTEFSLGRESDGGSAFGEFKASAPSPGISNIPENRLAIDFPRSVSESVGSQFVEGTLRLLDGAADVDLIIEIEISDPSELAISESITIPSGATSIPVVLSVIDDGWNDGDQRVTLEFSTTSISATSASETITVEDDSDAEPILVVNEIHAAYRETDSPEFADANRNGIVDAGGIEEFVELVNSGETALDLSGYSLLDSEALRHVFPSGTILDPGCAIVVFGGGAIEGNPAIFGGASVQNGNELVSEGLGFDDSSDSIRILDVMGFEISGATYSSQIRGGGSLVRNPDITGEFVAYISIGEGNQSFSPGYEVDGGTPFCPRETLTLSFDVASISEDAGAATLTVSRGGNIDAALSIALAADPSSEVALVEELTILAGETTATTTVNAVNDTLLDGDIEVRFRAFTPGFVDGSGTLVVEDDGDALNINIFINEIHAAATGASELEFIELYDGGVGNTPLTGTSLVLFNGNGDVSYSVLDLDGFTTNASGFFVAGAANVPGLAAALPGKAGSSLIQGGPDAVALVLGDATDFPNNTPPPAAIFVIDAVVYKGSDETLANLLGVTPADAGPSDSSRNSIQRIPDGGERQNSSNFQAAIPTPNAANGSGRNIMGSAAYETFASAKGITGSPTDDDDGDGIPNAVEFAIMGFEPGTADSLPLPVGNRISIPKSAEAGSDPDTEISVEISTDLVNWSTMETMEIANDDTSLILDYTGDSEVVFFRVSVMTTP